MSVAELVVHSYLKLSRYRWQLILLSAALILSCAFTVSTIDMEEDIAAMLPDRGSTVVRDFELLQKSPFARRAVINLHSPDASTGSLIAAADELAEALDPELYGKVSSGPDMALQTRLLPWLIEALPALLTPAELESLATKLDQGGVKHRLEENYAKLLAPEGWALKKLIRRDPLGLYQEGLDKLRYLNLIPGMRLVDGHFVSDDGHNVLLLAEPTVEITDSAGSRRLVQAFSHATQPLPENIKATLISGHRYTLANAEAIQGDLWLILSASSVAILALFLIFLRSLRALFVFLLPVAVVCIATLSVAMVFPTVSAITVGFGAVLLGITIDFGLHVYFALRHGDSHGAERLRGVVRPVLFGGLTTLAAFAVLLASDLPGQRQLAFFSITGIAVALVMALWLLPHLVPVGNAPELEVPDNHGPKPTRRRWVMAIWLLIVLAGASQLGGLNFNGDLRSMSLIPEELTAAEQSLRDNWGDFRGLAMLWSEGDDSETSFALNARLFQWLRENYPDETPVSLAPLLPPLAEQRANIANWQQFWQGEQGRRLLEDLRRESDVLGFSSQAFAPFFDALQKPAEVQTLATLEQAGLASILDALKSDGHGLLTLFPDHDGLREEIQQQFGESVIAVSPSGFRTTLSKAIDHDFRRFIISALVAVGLLLVLLFRRPYPVCAAAIPVVSGLLVMFGLMASLDMRFNLFNVVATILVIGLGIDYGIFMVCRLRDGLDRATDRAVLVSGLTTLAGFGALALARHPALHSIGITVLLGIGAALPAALLVIPALYRPEAS